jgi:hypothetical protein
MRLAPLPLSRKPGWSAINLSGTKWRAYNRSRAIVSKAADLILTLYSDKGSFPPIDACFRDWQATAEVRAKT